VHGGALHRVDASHPPVEAVWPLAAEVGGDALLRRLLPLTESGQSGQSAPNVPGLPGQTAPAARPPQDGHGAWPALHSSWLCPEMPFSIAFDLVPKVHPVVQRLPHPAAGRIGSPAFLGEPQPAAPVHAQRTHGVEPHAVQPAGRAERAERAGRAKQVKSAEIAAGTGVLASAA
jgi:hypothetical protein